MKLADIEDVKKPMALIDYARKHDYSIVQAVAAENYPHIAKMIKSCTDYLKSIKCAEFCIFDVDDHYQIMEDNHIWRVSLIGFVKRGEKI